MGVFFLSTLGFHLTLTVAEPLGIWGHSGYECRWGEGCFWASNDGGPGSSLDNTDEAVIEFRSQLSLDMFAKSYSILFNFVVDAGPLPLQDARRASFFVAAFV